MYMVPGKTNVTWNTNSEPIQCEKIQNGVLSQQIKFQNMQYQKPLGLNEG